MKRIHVVPGVAVALACLAAPASAGMGDLENRYEGRAERDPGTYFGFDVVKKDGVKKLAKVTAHLAYQCVSEGSARVTGRVKGKLAVEDRRFAGTLRGTSELETMRGGGELRFTYRVKGKLGKKGRARGEVDAEILVFPGPPVPIRGDDPIRCYSGGLDWKAKRGADLEPTDLM